MDVVIVQKRMIGFAATCMLFITVLVFVAGYFVGRTQTGPAKISIASFDQPSISESDPLPVPETAQDSIKQTEVAAETGDAADQQEGVIAPVAEEAEPKSDTREENPESEISANLQEDPKPETIAPEPENVSTMQKGFALQVAAFGNQKNAERFQEKLVEKGYSSAFIHEDDTAKNRLKFSVRIGFYSAYGTALQAANEFKVQEGRAAMIVNRTLTPETSETDSDSSSVEDAE